MSIRHLAVAVCVCTSSLLFRNFATADEDAVQLASAGTVEASDAGFLHQQESASSIACESHDVCSSGTCDCSPACCSSVCNSDDCCRNHDCGCKPYWHWIGGAEATYLDPRFHASGNPQADTTLRTIDPGWTAAPRIWLGAENNDCWGAQVRYWQLDDQRHRFDITTVQPDTVFDGTQSLTMYDIDAEITKRWELGDWNLAGSFGGRYGSLERLVTATGFGTIAPADSFAYIFDNRTSAGGVTGSIGVSRQLGDSPWEVFGCFRGSELWGDTSALFDARQNIAGTPSISDQSLRFSSELTIWEVQTGVQCSKYVDCFHGTVLARCAFEYQSWNWSVPGGNPGGGGVFNPGVELYGVAFAVGFTH